MKGLTKKLFSIMLAVMLAFTAMPFASINAYADDLDDAMGEFLGWIGTISGDDHSVLYTGLSDAYIAYVHAYDAKQTDDTADDEDALTKLRTALDSIEAVTPATGNFAPRLAQAQFSLTAATMQT